MTEREITSAIVELFPSIASWDHSRGIFVWKGDGDAAIREFKPCHDLQAIREIEDAMEGVLFEVVYPRRLVQVVRTEAFREDPARAARSDICLVVAASARQKAEAILRTHGKWGEMTGVGDGETAKFVISINDGYVEYSYPWELPADYSIDEIRRIFSQALGGPPSDEGEIRSLETS
jgi:hypothetical protein